MKRWGVFLLCLLLSGMMWLLRMLSQEYSELVSVSVIPESSINGRASKASSPVTVTARCTATGYSLLRISSRRLPSRPYIKQEDFKYVSGDTYMISSSDFLTYAGDVFGNGVSQVTFLSDSYSFRFNRESNRKVPVVVNELITFSPQYMSLGPTVTEPDSVTVYGEPSVLRNIEAVYTKQIMKSGTKTDQHGQVELLKPDGVRLSDGNVSYTIKVTRFVEIPVTVAVGTSNVPRGTKFVVFPDMAEVTCRCVFPLRDCVPEDISIYVDYKEFAGSISGRCLPHCENVPEGVISFSVSPEVFDCIEQ